MVPYVLLIGKFQLFQTLLKTGILEQLPIRQICQRRHIERDQEQLGRHMSMRRSSPGAACVALFRSAPAALPTFSLWPESSLIRARQADISRE